MSAMPMWFERKFEFTFPLQLYPNLCVRLRGTPARLEEILRDRPQALLVKKNGDKWSIQEQAGHILDLEPLWSARVEDFVAGRAQLTAADLTNRKTHEAGHNTSPLHEILRDFRAARLRLADRAEQLDPAEFARAILHPRLQQPMRLIDHLYFVAEHDDHHLASIWEMLKTK